MTVWAEGVFLLNAVLDYALLTGAVRLRGGVRTGRQILAALFGGGIALLALYPLPCSSNAGRFLSLFFLTVIAYGISLEAIRRGILFLLLSLTLCGIQILLAELVPKTAVLWKNGVLLQASWQSLTISAALLYGICALLCGAVDNKKRKLLSTQVTVGGRTVSFRALMDTGNFLRDPLTGHSVILADSTIAASLLNLERTQLEQPMETMREMMEERPELQPRLIPFRTIGTERGLLLAVHCQELWVDGIRREHGILAFSPGNVSEDGSYHGLTGG